MENQYKYKYLKYKVKFLHAKFLLTKTQMGGALTLQEELDTPIMKEAIDRIQGLFGYQFKNQAIFLEAITHASYMNEHKDTTVKSYDRLEFLGDAVLDLVTAKWLYTNGDPAFNSGNLTTLKIAHVSNEHLASISVKHQLEKYVRADKGNVITDKMRADIIESIIGAIFIDSGEDLRQVADSIIRAIGNPVLIAERNPITLINELAQKYKFGMQQPVIVAKPGLSKHQPVFVAEYQVIVFGKPVIIGVGEGANKKAAQEVAARDVLGKLREFGYNS